jgi:predicted secreted protein
MKRAFRYLRIVFSATCAIACMLLIYGFIRHDRSLSDAPYVEEYADWNRYSYAILPFGAAAIAPWLPWPRRFSLRTLLMATTLVAVVLGLWWTRSGIEPSWRAFSRAVEWAAIIQ